VFHANTSQAALTMKPTSPRTNPMTAYPLPATLPRLDETRWRDQKPIEAARGPSRMPTQNGHAQTSDRMPATKEAIARRSVRGLARLTALIRVSAGGGGTLDSPPGGDGGDSIVSGFYEGLRLTAVRAGQIEPPRNVYGHPGLKSPLSTEIPVRNGSRARAN
jgi:hypothetical protein